MLQARGKRRQRLGELLVESGMINQAQLKEALRKQAQMGGQLGSILVGMGYITTGDLLNFLSRQFGVPSADLLKTDISPELLKLIPIEKIKAMKVLPVGVSENSVTLAMVNPRDMISIRDIEFSLGKKVIAVVVPSSQMDDAIQGLYARTENFPGAWVAKKEQRAAETEEGSALTSLLRYLADSPAKDMLLTAGAPPSMKLGADIRRAAMDTLTSADCEAYARELMSEKDWSAFAGGWDYNGLVHYPEIGRFRVNMYRQRNAISITLRHIPDNIPSLQELGLPAWIKEYVLMPQGLIIVSGPAGHGRTTTLTALVDIVNSGRRCNIVTLEDPVEYLHEHKKSNVNQREIGADAQSISDGLKHVFRQDPDVIVIGETMDADGFDIALRAAETGHLVMTVFHANTAASAIEGIINTFPPHQRDFVRTGIAENLLFVL